MGGKRADAKAESKEKPKSEEKSKAESGAIEDDAGKAFIKAVKKLMEIAPSIVSDTDKIAAQQEALELILRAAEK